MRVDLERAAELSDDLSEGLPLPHTDEAAETIISLVRRVRELLSACAEVRQSTSHRQAVEAAQRGISGDDQAAV